MELKVSVFVLLSTLSSLSSVSQAKELREEIVRKKVIVNRPLHITSHISHFNPAAHEYTAEGNVVIDRVKPEVELYKPPEIKVPEPPKSLSKKVLVHSPETGFAENKHFDPAPHNYEAAGTLILNRDSPFLKTQQHIFQRRHSATSKKKPSDLVLTKSVLVKSPQAKESAISHFHSTPHVYAAVADVVIDKSESSANDHISFVRINENEAFENIDTKTKAEPEFTSNFVSGSEKEKSSSNLIATFSSRPRVKTGESVKKSVSVQLPEHRISAIDHFNPAGHKYAAQGNVEINREISLGSLDIKPVVRKSSIPDVTIIRTRQKPLRPIKRIEVIAPQERIFQKQYADVTVDRSVHTPTYKKPQTKTIRRPPFTTSDKGVSGLGIRKTVTVQLPEHRISAVDHFNPAGHKYAAEGGVEIERGASPGTVDISPVVQRPFIPDINIVRTRQRPSPPVKRIQITAPKERTPTKTYVDRKVLTPVVKVPATTRKETQIKTARRPSLSVSDRGLGIRKSVTVQLPEHRISAVDHFNPAGHKYAAEGGVEIERGASPGTVDISPVVQKPFIPDINIVRTRQRPSPPVKRIQITAPKERTPTKTYVDRKVLTPVVKVPATTRKETQIKTARRPSLSVSDRGLGIRKSVTVQLPEHRISAVDHFNPAGHKYAAEGGVEIERGASPGTVDISPVVQKPFIPDINIVRTRQRPSPPVKRIQVTAPKERTPTKTYVDRKVPTPVVKVPAPTYKETQIQTARRPSLSVSDRGLGIRKSVTVQLPEHRISAVDHFNPAGHKYAAEGGVEIERGASPGTVDISPVVQKPFIPDINIVRTRQRPSPPVKRIQITAPKERTPTKTYVDRKVLTPVVKVPATTRKETQIKTARRPSLSVSDRGLGIRKSVTVQLPEHRISAVDHFNPAGHKYAAEGGVEIERGASPGTVDISPVVQKPFIPDINIVRTKQRPSPPVKRIQVTAPKERTPTKPYVDRKVLTPVVKVPAPTHRETQIKTARRPSLSVSDRGLGIRKSVTVQLPEHRISAVDHFNPAGHKYAAEGGVEIERGASPGTVDISPVVQKPFIPDINIVRTRQRPSPPVQRIQVTAPKERTPTKPYVVQQVTAPKERTPTKPSVDRKVPTPVVKVSAPTYKETQIKTARRPPLSVSEGIRKSVTVQLPEHRISAVDHFNPAGHKYDAEGGVEIEREATPGIADITPVVQKPFIPVRTRQRPFKPDLPSQPSPTLPELTDPFRSVQIPVLLPGVKETAPDSKLSQRKESGESLDQKPTYDFGPAPVYEFASEFDGIASYLPPTLSVKRVPDKPFVPPSQPSKIFKLDKKVTVHSPVHASGVIPHFSPAVPVYEATGEVHIEV